MPVVLRKGRNRILVKAATGTDWSLRVGDSPLDRALTFVERRLWPEAAALYQNDPSVVRDAGLNAHAHFTKIALLAGEEQFDRDLCVELFERYRVNGNKSVKSAAAHVASLAPNPVLQEHYDEVIRMALGVASYSPGSAAQAYLTAAWASLQTGHLAEAEGHLAKLPDLSWVRPLAFPSRAVLAEKKGQHSDAESWLKQSLAHGEDRLSRRAHPQLVVDRDVPHPIAGGGCPGDWCDHAHRRVDRRGASHGHRGVEGRRSADVCVRPSRLDTRCGDAAGHGSVCPTRPRSAWPSSAA